MADGDGTPAKSRTRRGTTPAKRATRSTLKTIKNDQVAEDAADQSLPQPQPSQSQPVALASQQQQQQQQHARPAASSLTQNTLRLSGRLGSQLLPSTHGAAPGRSSASQSHAAVPQDEEDTAGQVNFDKHPPQSDMPSLQQLGYRAADFCKRHAQHAYDELHAGRLPLQLASVLATLLLLWLLASTVSSLRHASQTADTISVLSSTVQSTQQRMEQLNQLLNSTRNQQDGQKSSDQELRAIIADLQQQLVESRQTTSALQQQHAQQQRQWQGVLQDLKSQHESQQQQWERELAKLHLEVGTGSSPQLLPSAAAGEDAETTAQWARIRDSVFVHVRRVLDSFAADRTGLPDFALASAGGKVVGHSLLAAEGRPRWASLLQRALRLLPGGLSFVHPYADQFVLAPSGLPGQCLALNGSVGYVDIRLRQAVRPLALTLEHVPQAIAFDVRSAPLQLAVLGFTARPGGAAANGTRLAEAAYDLTASPVQTFKLQDVAQSFTHIRVQIISNHGHPKYTCLYRTRVHGHASQR